MSGYVSSSNDIVGCMKINNDGNNVQVNELNSNLEEADLRLIPHLHHAIIQGIQRVLAVSNDTDVFALVLYYTPEFVDLGAKEVWIMFGAGEKSRFLPMHILFQKLGPSSCKIIFKAHVLSGCDVTSKLGTKPASLNAKPGVYLRQFGEDNQLTIDEMKNAEKYQIKLLQPKSLCSSFDQLRFEMYRTRKISLIDLPPSSHCLKSHIQRCQNVVRQGIF